MRTTSTMARVFLLGFLVAALTSSSVYSATVTPTADPSTSTTTAAPAQNTDSTTTDPATMPTAAGTPAPGETTPPPAPDTTTVMDSDTSTGATGTTMAGGDTSGSMSSSSAPGANTDAPSATESTTAGPDATTAAVVTDAPGNTETSTSAPESTTMSTAGNNTGSSTPAADNVNTTTTPTSNGTATDATDSSAPPASSTPAPPASTTTTATGEGGTTTGSSSETDATATSPTVPSPSETSTDASTTTTTTPTTTATTPAPPVRPDGDFVLTLPFGSSPGDVLSCSPCDAEAIKKAVEDKFGDIPGFLYVSIVEQQLRRRKRETKVTVRVVFDPTELLEQLNQTARETIFADSINDLGNEAGISVNTTLSKSLATDFGEQTSSRCKISRACPAQYRCDDESQTCVHLCASETCSGNGKCQVEIGDDDTPRAVCMCNSGYETTYTGDKCEESETSKSKIIAILGGVLGTFCAILLIIVIVLCCRQRGFGDSSSKYELSGRRGYSNNAYSDDVNMKKMG